MSGEIKPFAEHGHYTQVHNAILDRVMPKCPPSAFKVLMFILRKTEGYHKDEDELSYSQIQKGTGIKSRDTIGQALEWLAKHEMVLITPTGHNTPTRYKINRDFSLPSVPETGIATVPEIGSTKESLKERNDKESKASLSDDAENGARPMSMGQYGIKELMDRLAAARERGAEVHTPTDRERKDFGQMFRQAAKDGHDTDVLLFALDYMVAKAAGEIEGEPRAWCGYRTALDRVVVDGWRPDGAMTSSEREQGQWAEDFQAETLRMMREAMEAKAGEAKP